MYIYPWQIDPLQSSIDALNTATPNFPSLSIDALNTTTPNLVLIAQCTYTHGRLTPPPPPIEHRSLENQYTKYMTYI